ncbi:site-specific integrase [Dyella sp. ASV21]|uniref:site-specific integrase n=1 Tax=Dyella sp. ASV21 TaxID=2795114 RepID=UPI001E3D5DF2|nr:site-specific integrase [Dyella sp. ASV21]
MKKNGDVRLPDLSPLESPERWAEEAAAAVRDILAEAASANTTRSYASALRYCAAWYQGRYGQPFALPLPEAVVIQFIVDHLTRRSESALAWELPAALDSALVNAGLKQRLGPLKLSTVSHRLAVLSKAHQWRRVTNPCEQPTVRHLIARARRAAVKRGERPTKKTAITQTELAALLATCDDSLTGLRDRALLLFAFASGGRRRSEVAAADLSDLRRVGERAFVYHLGHSKTQQAGPSAMSAPDKPILGPAADALAAWLEAAHLTEGPIFRRLWRHRVGDGLSPASVAAIVQRRADQAGLEGDFGGHSLRSGFVTEGGRQGIALPALMAMTEHRAVGSVIGYFQAGGVTDNPAAHLLDDRILQPTPTASHTPNPTDAKSGAP